MLVRGLLSRDMVIAPQIRAAFPISPMNSQSTPSSARVSDGEGFSWVSDEPVDDMLVRAVLDTEDVVFLGDMGVHSLGNRSRIRISQAADDEIVSWRKPRVHACELFSRSERDSDARGLVSP